MSSVIYPQGSITSNSTIVLAAMIGGDVYVMVQSTAPNGVEMVPAFTSGTCNTALPPNIIKWVVSSSGESLTFLSASGQFLTYSSGGTLLTQSTEPTKPIFFNQSSYEDEERPSILLSGVKYIPYGDDSVGVTLQVTVGTSLQSIELIPTPISLYMNCSAKEGDSSTVDMSLSLQLVRCSFNPTTSTSCPCSSLPHVWTNQVDCFNDNAFSYCAAGTNCSGNCKSRCLDPMKVCTYQGSSTYVCESPLPPLLPPTIPLVTVTPLSESGWFVAIIVLLILFIVGIFFLLYYWSEPDTPTVVRTQRTVSAYPSVSASTYQSSPYLL